MLLESFNVTLPRGLIEKLEEVNRSMAQLAENLTGENMELRVINEALRSSSSTLGPTCN